MLNVSNNGNKNMIFFSSYTIISALQRDLMYHNISGILSYKCLFLPEFGVRSYSFIWWTWNQLWYIILYYLYFISQTRKCIFRDIRKTNVPICIYFYSQKKRITVHHKMVCYYGLKSWESQWKKSRSDDVFISVRPYLSKAKSHLRQLLILQCVYCS